MSSSAVACANELGLEVPGHSQAISPRDPDKKGKGLDMTESECDCTGSLRPGSARAGRRRSRTGRTVHATSGRVAGSSPTSAAHLPYSDAR